MEVLEDSERVQSNLRLAVERTGSIEWADFAQHDHACKNNLLISHVLVGDDCDVQNFAHWCHELKKHVAIINVTNEANTAGKDMQKFFVQVAVMSAHDAIFQHKGKQRVLNFIKKAMAKSPVRAAPQ